MPLSKLWYETGMFWLFVLTGLTGNALGQSLSALPLRYVCTTSYYPMCKCDGMGEFGGYEVELFKRTAELLASTSHPEWSTSNYTFVCWDTWDAMLAELAKPAGQRKCDVVAAGVSATSERIASGFKFSYPTFQAGRRIMVYSSPKFDMWWWTKHLEPRLWLLFFGTSAAVGAAILLAEIPWTALWQHPQPALAKASNLQWGAAALLVKGAPHLSPRSPGGRVILLAFAFMVLIVTNLYTAAATARMVQESSRKLVINDMADLTNRPTGIFVDDRKAFERFALQDPVYYEWSTFEDQDIMMSGLRNGVVDALVLDAPWVEYMVANECDLFTVGSLVLPVNMGFVFPSDTTDQYMADVDSVLSLLDDQGVLAQLEHDIVRPSQHCPSLSARASEMTIKLDMVAGLWVILAAAVAVGVGWNAATLLLRGFLARMGAGAVSGSSLSMTSRSAVERRLSGDGSGSQSSKAVNEGGAKPLLPCLESCMPLFGPSPPGASVLDSWVPIADAATVDEAVQVVDARLRHADNHIKHLPWVISAIMDAKLSSLRQELALHAAATSSQPPGSGLTGTGTGGSIRNRAVSHLTATTNGCSSAHVTAAGQQGVNSHNSNNASQRGSGLGSDTVTVNGNGVGSAVNGLGPATLQTNAGSAASAYSLPNSMLGNGTEAQQTAASHGANGRVGSDGSCTPQLLPPQQMTMYDQQFLKQAAQIKAATVAASATVAAAAAAGASVSAHGSMSVAAPAK